MFTPRPSRYKHLEFLRFVHSKKLKLKQVLIHVKVSRVLTVVIFPRFGVFHKDWDAF